MPGRQKLADRFERIMGEKGRVLGEQYDKKSIYSFILPYRPSEKPLSGSSDVGDVSWVCPTSQIVAATCAGGTPEHTWQMVSQGKSSIAHKGLLYAGKVLAAAAIDLLDDPELVKKAAEEFKRKTGPRRISAAASQGCKALDEEIKGRGDAGYVKKEKRTR